MKKTSLFIAVLLSLNAFSINAINKEKYNKQFEELNEIKKSKVVGSALGEFKHLTNNFSYVTIFLFTLRYEYKYYSIIRTERMWKKLDK